MKKAYLILFPLAMLAAAACQSLEPEQPGQQAQGPEIRFSSSIGDYTKATDKSFEAGDLAGLSISDPVNVSNVKLTYSDGTFTPERTLYWALDQAADKKCTFLAYSPYSASVDPGKAFAWTIPADQSAAGAYAAADLVTAKTQAGPADGTVHLSFNHALSRMVLTLENKVADDEVAGVKLNGVKLGASVDIAAGTVTATGDAAAVTPATVSNAYVFLVAPQTVSPEILITMKSGKVVRYTPDAALTFAAGKQLSAAITVEKDKVLFSAEILDWLDSKAFLGKTEDPGVGEHIWYVEYNNGLQPFEELEDGTFHQVFSIGSMWAQIRIVKDNYAEVWGCAIPNYGKWLTLKEPTDVIPMAPNDYFYIQGDGDLFDMVLDPKAKTLTVTLLEHKWESIGTGIFIDGLVTEVFSGIPHEEIEVEVMVDENAPGLYRIMNPYKNWSWKEEFDYTDDTFIELHTLTDGRVWFAESFLGLSYGSYGDFYGFTRCPETGWAYYSDYGWFYPREGFFQFTSRMGLTLSNYGTYYVNQSGMMSLTLPGFERPVHYYTLQDRFNKTYVDEEGKYHLVLTLTPGMDIALVKYGLYAGTLSREEVYGDNQDGLLFTEVKPNGTPVKDLWPDAANTVDIIVPQGGAYTVVWYAENAAGQYVRATFGHYAATFDGYELPEPAASISAQPAQPLSDLQLLANVKFTDPNVVRFLAMTENAWTESGLTEDDIYDYVLSNGEPASSYYIHSKTGIDLTLGALTPDTQYRLFVAGTDVFGSAAWAQTTAKTNASPAFTSVGTGRYTDNFFYYQGKIQEKYTVAVDIQKAETTPVRYRVVNPYKELWAKYDQEVSYSGFYAQNIDFYLDGELLKYDPYYNGYKEEGYGDMRYYCYNPGTTTIHYSGNCVLQEGVYNVAPYAFLEGSGAYYNLTGYEGVILIEMPGYTYTPEPAPARAAARKNLVEAPAPAGLMVQDTVRPFTRHMLNTGTPKVTRSQRQFSEISAEPIKK